MLWFGSSESSSMLLIFPRLRCRGRCGALPSPLRGGVGRGVPRTAVAWYPHSPTPPRKGEGGHHRCGDSGASHSRWFTLPRPNAPPSLVALRERIGLDEIGGLVDQFVLAVRLGAADAGLRPEVMVLVDADVAFRRALELDAGRGRRDLVDIEAAAPSPPSASTATGRGRPPASRRRSRSSRPTSS